MKIKIIIPYFGAFPPYFALFLRSCAINSEVEFHIFTDQSALPPCPQNVVVHELPFSALRALMQKKLGLRDKALRVLTPYKLCDCKPAYGVIFEDHLQDADFWGFCDVDLIFGRIFDLLSMEEVQKSERVLTQGHLTLYRNSPRMNRLFEQPLAGGIAFRRAIEIPEPCFFDEIFMPAICRAQGVIQYGENRFADILPQYGGFVMARLCTLQNEDGQRFFWERGRLWREYARGGQTILDELMYLHLQKRPLPYHEIEPDYPGRIYITPQGFFREEAYSAACEQPDGRQRVRYQKKRWRALTLRKLWIKGKVWRFKESIG